MRNARRNLAHLVVDLAGRAAENEGAEGVARDLNVAKGAQDVDLGVCEDDACARRVLDRVLGLAADARDAPNGAREVIALEGLHVRDLERFWTGGEGG